MIFGKEGHGVVATALEWSSSSSSVSSGGSHDGNNKSDAGTVSKRVAQEESLVVASKRMFLIVIVVFAVIIGYASYTTTTYQQQDEFIHDYYITADAIVQESEIRIGNVIGSIYTMSNMATVLALRQQAWEGGKALKVIQTNATVHGAIEIEGSNSTSSTTLVGTSDHDHLNHNLAEEDDDTATTSSAWPFVTFPYFDSWAGGVNFQLTGALSLSYSVFVNRDQRDHWERFIKESILQEEDDELVTPYIWRYDPIDNETKVAVGAIHSDRHDDDQYAVLVQSIPHVPGMVNYDESKDLAVLIETVKHDQMGAMSKMFFRDGRFYSLFLQPIFEDIEEPKSLVVDESKEEASDDSDDHHVESEDRNVVGYFKAELPWDNFFLDLLPEDAEGIQVVIHTECNGKEQSVTYDLVGAGIELLGEGDLHDPTHEDMVVVEHFRPLKVFSPGGLATSSDSSIDRRLDSEDEAYHEQASHQLGCAYEIRIYPAESYRQGFIDNQPVIYTVVGVSAILCAAILFMVYDWFVQQRQKKMMATANRTNAIVNSLFPETVQERLFDKPDVDDGQAGQSKKLQGANRNIAAGIKRPSKPIADLFASATVMFADFVGFTAWASVREPSQVFLLLEAVYDSFDKIAKKNGVFKVETIGDCYVAACGLPTPRDDHAVVMAKFATACMNKMIKVVNNLQVVLGPGTEDLAMRFGLHSGQVMAGVLRGEKSRFQLFGDTVNTAARIESSGESNKVHLSSHTANLLIAHDKSHWIEQRSDKVVAKGKGELTTYWLLTMVVAMGAATVPSTQKIPDMSSRMDSTDCSASFSQEEQSVPSSMNLEDCPQTQIDKTERLVNYNTEVLLNLLKKIVAIKFKECPGQSSADHLDPLRIKSVENETVLDEVKEIIMLPSTPAKFLQDPELVQLPEAVVSQTRAYVKTIASMYNSNPFHSFEHASHVTMSITKLLSRVVTPDAIDYTNMTYTQRTKGAQEQHQFTYGIASDPLTQFAVAFSALIHDVDHQGVPNTVLVKEGTDLAKMYKNQSVAEQNSVELAWALLMEPPYKDLRSYIYSTQEEMDRFRQLVVNAVMATDIIDKDLGALRKARWAKAFDDDDKKKRQEESPLVAVNRKATIVIEHLIQASDVAHTMQHWHVYLKWNKKLFMELYRAYKEGRSDTDPSIGWYKGEIGFFDFYLIPLAKKLESCGVFGVSSDEYLDYATANRHEWVTKGQEIVKEYVEEAQKLYA